LSLLKPHAGGKEEEYKPVLGEPAAFGTTCSVYTGEQEDPWKGAAGPGGSK